PRPQVPPPATRSVGRPSPSPPPVARALGRASLAQIVQPGRTRHHHGSREPVRSAPPGRTLETARGRLAGSGPSRRAAQGHAPELKVGDPTARRANQSPTWTNRKRASGRRTPRTSLP